jgi:hypothetical protein
MIEYSGNLETIDHLSPYSYVEYIAQKILVFSVLLCVECHALVLLVQVHASIVVLLVQVHASIVV